MMDPSQRLIKAVLAWYYAESTYGSLERQPRLVKEVFAECYVYEEAMKRYQEEMRKKIGAKEST